MDGNQITNEVSCSTKCGSDLQTFKHDENLIENLCFQILVISRQNTPFYVSFHQSEAFTFSPGFVTNFTIHTICVCIIAAGQITHRIPVISNWNFWFCWFKNVWLQVEFFRVSHSFNFWLSARQRQRSAGGHLAK